MDLARRWIHSHEEDSDDELVFRPAGYAFPPSRGREAFELHADGSYAGSVPGPADKPQATEGEWTLEEGGRLRLGDRVLEITEAAGDVLRVRRAG